VDALVPTEHPTFAFLDGHPRIKARKFRGVFSQGLLVPAPEGAQLGDDLADYFGVTKYEPPEPMSTGGEIAPPPSIPVPIYTDIEHLRRYAHLFVPGEMVVVTEKVHGANGRWCLVDGQIHAGSHYQWKIADAVNIWWKVVTPRFRSFLDALPEGYVVFGEVYGSVQSLKYGHGLGKVSFVMFDIFDTHNSAYLDWQELAKWQYAAKSLDSIESVPALAVMPFNLDAILQMAEQDSWLYPGQIMEGVVVRPIKERYNDETGRTILKVHSQRYLLKENV
jgi:RNA ligase (TIGR02306 family)